MACFIKVERKYTSHGEIVFYLINILRVRKTFLITNLYGDFSDVGEKMARI